MTNNTTATLKDNPGKASTEDSNRNSQGFAALSLCIRNSISDDNCRYRTFE